MLVAALVIALNGCQRMQAPQASAPPSIASTPPTPAPTPPTLTAPPVGAGEFRVSNAEPRTYTARVQSMTDGAFPAGMDGKGFLLFSPGWRARWVNADGQPVALNVDQAGVFVLEQRVATEQVYRDLQVHVEFRVPPPSSEETVAVAEVLLHGAFGIVLTDSMNRPQRDNGCGAISGRYAPDAAACFPPGAWQTLDIAFRAPRTTTQATAAQPARLTVLHNGVLIHNAVDVDAPTEPDAPAQLAERAPLALVPRAGAMELRNLWVRTLDAGLLPPIKP